MPPGLAPTVEKILLFNFRLKVEDAANEVALVVTGCVEHRSV